MGLVVKLSCGDFCIACLRPLTRRYVLRSKVWKQRKYQREMNH
ncbi:hypothetical protein V8043_004338 [Vibrio vulnificus]